MRDKKETIRGTRQRRPDAPTSAERGESQSSYHSQMGECSKQERAQIAEEASWKHRGEVDGDLQGRGAFLQSVLGWPRSLVLVLVFRAVHGAWGSVHIWLCGRGTSWSARAGRSSRPAGGRFHNFTLAFFFFSLHLAIYNTQYTIYILQFMHIIGKDATVRIILEGHEYC